MLAAALAGAALTLGCQESGFDESKETARPLKVQDSVGPLGGTKVPGQAERPLTLNADALGDTLALGVRPVLAALPAGRVPAYLRERVRDVEVVPSLRRDDLGVARRAEPDVILGSNEGQGRLYPSLRKIAPTIMTDGGGAAWELSVRLHGEALGRTNDAERLLIDWDRRAAALDGKLGENPDQTKVSVALVTAGAVLTAGAESFPGKVLADVGLARPPAQDGTRESETISRGQLGALDGDVILLSVAPGAARAAKRLQSSAAWRRLSAVRSGGVHRVDAGTWWTGGGILAARAALRDLDRAL
jgi:iron complex transport system substrate-binding protein